MDSSSKMEPPGDPTYDRDRRTSALHLPSKNQVNLPIRSSQVEASRDSTSLDVISSKKLQNGGQPQRGQRRKRGSQEGSMDGATKFKKPSGPREVQSNRRAGQDLNNLFRYDTADLATGGASQYLVDVATDIAPPRLNNPPQEPKVRGKARNAHGQVRPKQPTNPDEMSSGNFQRPPPRGPASTRHRPEQTSAPTRFLPASDIGLFMNSTPFSAYYSQETSNMPISHQPQGMTNQSFTNNPQYIPQYGNVSILARSQNTAAVQYPLPTMGTPGLTPVHSVGRYQSQAVSATTPTLLGSPLEQAAMSSMQLVAPLSSSTVKSQAAARRIQSIPEDQLYVDTLKGLCIASEILASKGYAINVLTQNQLNAKKKCSACNKAMPKEKPGRNAQKPNDAKPGSKTGLIEKGKPESSSASNSAPANSSPQSEIKAKIAQPADPAKPSKTDAKPILHCKFHPGTLQYNNVWSCCRKNMFSEPCSGNANHQVREYLPGELETQWQHYHTPLPASEKNIRTAVAIDCEMGTASSGDSELIRVTMVDFFSGEVLIDNLICPSVPMSHYNTKWSGVTRSAMEKAKSQATCIFGRDNARRAVWNFVGPSTIVVAHSGNNDLGSLRWIHLKIVDTFLIEAIPAEREEARKRAEEKVAEKKRKEEEEKAEEEKAKARAKAASEDLDQMEPSKEPGKKEPEKKEAQEQKGGQVKKPKNKGSGKLSLKTLAKEKLGWDIQVGKGGHDSLEDALATRGLADWHVKNFKAKK